jgi:hypothetical protein
MDDSAQPDDLEIFDTVADGVACRVCGALVADQDAYRRAHWEWHEASNGA